VRAAPGCRRTRGAERVPPGGRHRRARSPGRRPSRRSPDGRRRPPCRVGVPRGVRSGGAHAPSRSATATSVTRRPRAVTAAAVTATTPALVLARSVTRVPQVRAGPPAGRRPPDGRQRPARSVPDPVETPRVPATHQLVDPPRGPAVLGFHAPQVRPFELDRAPRPADATTPRPHASARAPAARCRTAPATGTRSVPPLPRGSTSTASSPVAGDHLLELLSVPLRHLLTTSLAPRSPRHPHRPRRETEDAGNRTCVRSRERTVPVRHEPPRPPSRPVSARPRRPTAQRDGPGTAHASQAPGSATSSSPSASAARLASARARSSSAASAATSSTGSPATSRVL
jgi:hypothetical protein